MPTLTYPQVIDDSPSPLRILWDVEWDIVPVAADPFPWLNGRCFRVVITSIEHRMYQVELTKGCWHRVSPAPEEYPEGQGGSMQTAEEFYRELLNKNELELVQAACEEMYQSNPKLYQEAA